LRLKGHRPSALRWPRSGPSRARLRGHAEIKRLIEDAVVAAKAIFTPDTVRQEDGQVVVEGPAHGDFRGSPIRFTYRCTLENDAIKALEITA
jgi:hypothetical protein